MIDLLYRYRVHVSCCLICYMPRFTARHFDLPCWRFRDKGNERACLEFQGISLIVSITRDIVMIDQTDCQN